MCAQHADRDFAHQYVRRSSVQYVNTTPYHRDRPVPTTYVQSVFSSPLLYMQVRYKPAAAAGACATASQLAAVTPPTPAVVQPANGGVDKKGKIGILIETHYVEDELRQYVDILASKGYEVRQAEGGGGFASWVRIAQRRRWLLYMARYRQRADLLASSCLALPSMMAAKHVKRRGARSSEQYSNMGYSNPVFLLPVIACASHDCES
jgi:hypothetical protein